MHLTNPHARAVPWPRRFRDGGRASLLEAKRVNDNLVAGYDYGIVDGRR